MDPGALDEDAYPSRAPRGKRLVRTSHIPFSSGAKKALELSLREANRLGSREIRAAHVALGVLGTNDPDLPRLATVRTTLWPSIEERLRRAA